MQGPQMNGAQAQGRPGLATGPRSGGSAASSSKRRVDQSEHREDTQPNERDFYNWRRPSEPPVVTDVTHNPRARTHRPHSPLRRAPSASAAATGRFHGPAPSSSNSAPLSDPRDRLPRLRDSPRRDRQDSISSAPSRPAARSRPQTAEPSSAPAPRKEYTRTIVVSGFRRSDASHPAFRGDLLSLFSSCGPILDSMIDLGSRAEHPPAYIDYENSWAATRALSMHGRPGPGTPFLHVTLCRRGRNPFEERAHPPPSVASPRQTASESRPNGPSPASSPQRYRPAPSRLASTAGAWAAARPDSRNGSPPPVALQLHTSDKSTATSRSRTESSNSSQVVSRPPSPPAAESESHRSDHDRPADQSRASRSPLPNASVNQDVPMPSSSQVTEEGDDALEDSAVMRVDLPADCKGTTKDAMRKRQAFRVDTLKKLAKEGKVVLDNSFENDALVVTYLEEAGESQQEMPPPALPAREATPIAASANRRARVDEMEDVKPHIRAQSSPAVSPVDPGPALQESSVPALTFPRPLQPSPAPVELQALCAKFIREFFLRHQQSRAALQDFYVPSAMFSCKAVDGTSTDRDRMISPAYDRIVNKIYITPTPISHAIARIPAFECDTSTFTFDAVELESLSVRGARPILLDVHGYVEEFPSHERVSFSRSFVLIRPSASNLSNPGCPVDLVIQSDQVVYRPYEHGTPRPFQVSSTAAVAQSTNKRAAFEPASQDRPAKRTVRDTSIEVSEPVPRQEQPPLFLPRETASPEVERRMRDDSRRPHPAGPFASRQPPTSQADRASSVRPAVSAPAIRDRSQSPEPGSSSDDGMEQLLDRAALSRRHERQATVVAELNGPMYTRDELDKVVSETVRRELANMMAMQKQREQDQQQQEQQRPAASSSTDRPRARGSLFAPASAPPDQRSTPAQQQQHASSSSTSVPAPPPLRPRTPPESDDEVDDGDDGPVTRRWPIRVGETQAIETRLSGATNKLRYLCPKGNSGFYALTSGGDILDWAGSSKRPVVAVHKGASEDKVDDFAVVRDTLVVGYLGNKVPGEKELAQPKSQVRLFTVKNGELVSRDLKPRPHLTGGVTSLTPVPGNRLKWVTAGQDKTIYLWTQSSTTREVRTTNIATTHSNVVTSLAYLDGRANLASAGEDKRVLLYDLSAQQPIWKGMLDSRVLHVSAVPFDQNLVLYRTSAASKQFAIYDARKACSAGPVASWGFALPTRHGSSSSTSTEVSFGRYFRGDWIESIFAHPDASTGIKLWDVRKIDRASTVAAPPPMASLTCGRSKVLQVLFDGRPTSEGDRIILGEQSYFTACKLL